MDFKISTNKSELVLQTELNHELKNVKGYTNNKPKNDVSFFLMDYKGFTGAIGPH